MTRKQYEELQLLDERIQGLKAFKVYLENQMSGDLGSIKIDISFMENKMQNNLYVAKLNMVSWNEDFEYLCECIDKRIDKLEQEFKNFKP
jgi:hypothetical protein